MFCQHPSKHFRSQHAAVCTVDAGMAINAQTTLHMTKTPLHCFFINIGSDAEWVYINIYIYMKQHSFTTSILHVYMLKLF